MKKIKIITFQNANNYGALLQAYALQSKLSEKYNVEIIDYKNKIIEKPYKVININTENLTKLIKSFIKSIIFYFPNVNRYKKMNKFRNQNMNLTDRKYYTEEELKEKSIPADVYITGSDQVWNSDITLGLQDSYTLNFGNKTINRISYAASLGNIDIDEQKENIYINKISRINHISVREERAKEILSRLIKKNIDVVLDPTMLLTKFDWIEKTKNLKKEKEKYILSYFVDPDKEFVKIVNKVAEKEKLKVIHFALRKNGVKHILRSAYTDGPFEFINLIKNAEYIICTSFHATVFSIIFNKKFWVIPHRKTGSRVTNLLKKLDIAERAVDSLEEFEKLDYDKEIDYAKVNKILEIERKKSIEWLENAIDSD